MRPQREEVRPHENRHPRRLSARLCRLSRRGGAAASGRRCRAPRYASSGPRGVGSALGGRRRCRHRARLHRVRCRVAGPLAQSQADRHRRYRHGPGGPAGRDGARCPGLQRPRCYDAIRRRADHRPDVCRGPPPAPHRPQGARRHLVSRARLGATRQDARPSSASASSVSRWPAWAPHWACA